MMNLINASEIGIHMINGVNSQIISDDPSTSKHCPDFNTCFWRLKGKDANNEMITLHFPDVAIDHDHRKIDVSLTSSWQ